MERYLHVEMFSLIFQSFFYAWPEFQPEKSGWPDSPLARGPGILSARKPEGWKISGQTQPYYIPIYFLQFQFTPHIFGTKTLFYNGNRLGLPWIILDLCH